MRFPSLQLILVGARATLWRFPAALVSAAVAAVAGVAAMDDHPPHDDLIRTLVTAALGISLLIVVTLSCERRRLRGRLVILPHLIALVVLIAFFLLWPHWSEGIRFRRTVQLAVGFHLLVAYLPFMVPGERNGFWQFNRALFMRALTSALYSGVLFAGLAIALLALDKLLGVDFEETIYPRLFVIIAFVFNTWFFLGGVPADLPALDRREDYPPGLKLFSQYILTPIVAVYIVILTAYMMRIIATGVWPSGWIGYLVSCVAVVGMLSLLLVHPIQDRPENRWVRTYARGFYIALLPSIAMLLLAIWKRVDQYGITENRYFLIVLALWLAAIAVYFTVRRPGNIKVVPATLAVLALVTSLGPWGAYAVSRRSQEARLDHLLTANGLWTGTAIRPATAADSVSFETRRELSGVLEYLVDVHGAGTLRPWFGDLPAPAVGDETKGRLEDGPPQVRAASVAMGRLGLEYVGRWEVLPEGASGPSVNLIAEADSTAVPITGYAYACRVERSLPAEFAADGRRFLFDYDGDRRAFVVLADGDSVLTLPVDGMIEAARAYRRDTSGGPSLPAPMMRLTAESEHLRAMFVVRSFMGPVGEKPSVVGDLYLAPRP